MSTATRQEKHASPRYVAEIQDGKWYVIDTVANMRLGPYWNAKEMASYWNESGVPERAP